MIPLLPRDLWPPQHLAPGLTIFDRSQSIASALEVQVIVQSELPVLVDPQEEPQRYAETCRILRMAKKGRCN